MNRSGRELGRGLVTDGGPPRCLGCNLHLQFGTDREGRTTESCTCGYRAYLRTRGGQVPVQAVLPVPVDFLLP